MEYNYELFTTDREKSTLTSYNQILSGAFYDVYSNGVGDFHMAVEDQASLLERIKFYNEFISQKPYLVFDKNPGMNNNVVSPNMVLSQVLGLPQDVLDFVDKGNKKSPNISTDAIVKAIHFEKGLFSGYGSADKVNKDILRSDHYSVLGCINYLISKGIFFQNLERLIKTDDPNGSYYPVYVDESLLPEKWFKEKETSEKLLFDFASELNGITDKVFISQFRKIDKMSFSELFDFAYNVSSFSIKDFGTLGFQKAVRRYLNALLLSLVETFYDYYFNCRDVFGDTVLKHDFKTYEHGVRYIYIGEHFNMFNKDYREFSLGQNGLVTEKNNPTDYYLDSKEKERLRFIYISVHRYFEKHPDLKYMPALFLRFMGLPYAIFKRFAFFDFERGTADDFLSLVPFIDDVSFEKYGILLPIAMSNGSLSYYEKGDSPIPFYLRHLEDEGLFISSFPFIEYDGSGSALISFLDKDKKIKKLVNGDYSTYRNTVDASESYAFKNSKTIEPLSDINDFLIKDEKNGVYVTIAKFFSYLNEGFDTTESLSNVLQGENQLQPGSFLALINGAIGITLEKDAISYCDSFEKKQEKELFLFASQEEEFKDDFLPLTHVHKGRIFTAYSDDEDKEFYFDSADKIALENLHKIFRRYFLINNSFPYLLSYNGEEKIYSLSFPECRDYLSELAFLGLPNTVINTINSKKDPLPQIKYRDNISLYLDEKHKGIIKEDESLSIPAVTVEGLRRGVYLLGNTSQPRAFYVLKENLDDTLRLYFSPDFMQIVLQGEKEKYKSDSETSSIDDLLKNEDDDVFRQVFLSFVYGTRAIDDAKGKLEKTSAELAYNYGGHLSRSLSRVLYHTYYNESDKCRHYLVSYKAKIGNENLYVSPGFNFFAFSYDQKLSSFFLLKRDKAAFMTALEAVRNRFSAIKHKKERARKMAYFLGLPVCFLEKTYRLLVTDINPSSNTLNKLFGFVDKDYDQGQLLSYEDSLRTMKPTLVNFYSSTQLHSECLKTGLFLFPKHQIMEYDYESIPDLEKDIKDFPTILSAEHIYVSPSCLLETRDAFFPTKVTYSFYLSDFLSTFKNTDLKSDFLFYAREALEYAYYKDDFFIQKAINYLQLKGREKYQDYLDKIFKKFHLREFKKSVNSDDLYGIIGLFVLFLEQKAINSITKRMKKTEK